MACITACVLVGEVGDMGLCQNGKVELLFGTPGLQLPEHVGRMKCANDLHLALLDILCGLFYIRMCVQLS